MGCAGGLRNGRWRYNSFPGFSGMASGALPPPVIRRPCVAGLAIGVAATVVERDISPIAGVVTTAALARPMPIWRSVARDTIGQAGVVDGHNMPVFGAVAVGALPGPMVFWRGVAGGAVCEASVVDNGILPIGRGVAVGTLPRPMAAGPRMARLAVVGARVAEDDF